MNAPALIFGIILSTLYGALFHLWRGGGLGRLVLYLILGWIGFWAGQWLATKLNLMFLSVGELHLGMATICSFALLALGYWLSPVNKQQK